MPKRLLSLREQHLRARIQGTKAKKFVQKKLIVTVRTNVSVSYSDGCTGPRTDEPIVGTIAVFHPCRTSCRVWYRFARTHDTPKPKAPRNASDPVMLSACVCWSKIRSFTFPCLKTPCYPARSSAACGSTSSCPPRFPTGALQPLG